MKMKMKKIGLVVGMMLVLVMVAEVMAAPEDWGPPTGYPTIDAWRRAGRQNDRERWERERYYNEYYKYPSGHSNGNGNYYPNGYYSQQPSISITIPLPPPPWAR